MSESARRSETIVIVDDDDAVLNALAFAFEVEGYQVKAFSDAESALQNDLGDCVCYLLDEQLPGLGGLDLYDALRAKGARAPAILITTPVSKSTRHRAAAEGVLMVEKPLLGNQLATKVRKAVARAQGQSL